MSKKSSKKETRAGVLNQFGIQSYCFRAFKDNRKVIRLLLECGVSQIELCGVHAYFTKPSSFADVLRLYQDAGVEIVSIGVQGLHGNKKTEAPFFDCVKQAGARFMSVTFGVDSLPASFRTAEKLAAEYDVRLAIHNHGGRDWLGSAAMLRHVFANTGERIGLCLDTAWALDSGEDPVAMAEEFGKRLYGLHIKDFIFDRARRPKDVVTGKGNLKMKEFMKTLKKVNFRGYTVIEYEGDANNPVPALKKCVVMVRKAAQHTGQEKM